MNNYIIVLEHSFMVWKTIILFYLFFFILLYRYKFQYRDILIDITVSAGGVMSLAGVNNINFIVFIKYMLISLFIFYLIRLISSSLKNYYRIFIISIFQLLYLFIPVVNFIYFIVTGKGIGREAIFAIVQTNFYEATHYLIARPTLIILSIMGICILFIILCSANKCFYQQYLVLPSKRAKFIIGVILLFSMNYMVGHVLAQSNLYSSYKESRNFIVSITNHKVPSDLEAINLNHNDKNIVIVIGESANRDYFSLYGFEQETTPWLDTMKTNKNFIWLENAYSCDKYTGKVLPMALSEHNQYNKIKMENSADLIDVFHKAGYKVWWISNQGRDNNIEESFMNIAMRADYKTFVSNNGSVYDEAMISYIPDLKYRKGNIIIFHQMGSHGNYIDRSPESFKKFHFPGISKNDNSLDEYCNSIFYTDYVLQNIFAACQDKVDMDAFIYFSDHGEKPGVPRDRFDYAMTRIPIFIWFSNDYRNVHRTCFEELETRRVTYFTNDMLYDTILGIADIKTNHYNSIYDLSSPDYGFNRQNLLTEYGSLRISDDPYDVHNR